MRLDANGANIRDATVSSNLNLLSTGMLSRLAYRISQIESARDGGVRALAADLFVTPAGVEPAVVSVFGRPLDVIDH